MTKGFNVGGGGGADGAEGQEEGDAEEEEALCFFSRCICKKKNLHWPPHTTHGKGIERLLERTLWGHTCLSVVAHNSICVLIETFSNFRKAFQLNLREYSQQG